MSDTKPTPTIPADAPDPRAMLEQVREDIFRGRVTWVEDELDAERVYMTSRATYNGLDLRRVVHKPTRRTGYALVQNGKLVEVFPVADASGVFLKGDVRPGVWLSEGNAVERALVARAERAAAAAPASVPL